ncbi:peptidase C14 [Rhizoctonia solani]|nr:peptidase C14 [Rhizoctonia solani]
MLYTCSSPVAVEQQVSAKVNIDYISEKSATNNAHAYSQQTHGQSSNAFQPGRKKALCIGINYIGQTVQLQGCINDVHNIANFLTVQFGYKKESIRKLTDDATDPRDLPTKDNIITAMRWLVADAQPTDSFFFHFSGHGGQTKDLDGDEADGFDEVIYPLDFEHAGHIVDDDIHEIMVRPLSPGCRLTAIFDCSHSGSALDLPYTYSTEGKLKEHRQLTETGRGLLNVGKFCARGDMSSAIKGLSSVIRPTTSRRARKQAMQLAREMRGSEADVVSWSACKDSEKSDDAFEGHEAVGAMSYAFIQSLRQKPRQSYRELLNNVRSILRSNYQQKPQLSSSHPIDTDNWFIA